MSVLGLWTQALFCCTQDLKASSHFFAKVTQSWPHAMFAKCYINSSTKLLCVLESSKIFIFKVKFLLPGILEAFLHLPFIIIFVESCIL